MNNQTLEQVKGDGGCSPDKFITKFYSCVYTYMHMYIYICNIYMYVWMYVQYKYVYV